MSLIENNVFSKGTSSSYFKDKRFIGAPKAPMFNRLSVSTGPYDYSIGINASLNPGIMFRHYLTQERAFEIDLGTRWNGISLTGLYEACISTGSVGPGLILNSGIGPRLGFFNGNDYRDYLGRNLSNHTYSMIGLVAMIGLEYYFPKIPFSIGVDYRPFFDFNKNGDSFLDGAVFLTYDF